jgi:hypothetical protein
VTTIERRSTTVHRRRGRSLNALVLQLCAAALAFIPVASPSRTLFDGMLAGFAAEHSGYATGRRTWEPADEDETRSFRFRVPVQDVPAAAGKSVTFGFSWRTEAA